MTGLGKTITIETVRKIKYHFYRLHDSGVNQKYGNSLPYSFHLGSVKEQLFKIRKLLYKQWNYTFDDVFTAMDTPNMFFTNQTLFALLIIACYAHDSIEDARLTYNDLVNDLMKFGLNKEQALFVADIVFAVTDEKGKSRSDRKSKKYYQELFLNEYAVVIKLADLMANAIHSITFNHSSVENKLSEFDSFVFHAPDKIKSDYSFVFQYLHQLLSQNAAIDNATKKQLVPDTTQEPIPN